MWDLQSWGGKLMNDRDDFDLSSDKDLLLTTLLLLDDDEEQEDEEEN